MQVYGFIQQINALCGDTVINFRFAMHAPERDHVWRKPSTGMVQDLAAVYDLDLSRCAMVGDSERGKTCAHATGIGEFFWIGDVIAEL